MLGRFELRPRRRLSQHFLVDPRVARRVADAVAPGPADRVLEIGPGLGAITIPLGERAGSVVAVEKDGALARALAWVLREHQLHAPGGPVRVVAADVLTLSLERIAPSLVAGNLPYAITSPLLLALARSRAFARAVVMVQKEVADRLVAPPGSGAYGSLTVAVAAHVRVRRLFDVSRRCFFPPPEVDSTVMSLEPHEGRPGALLGEALETVLRAAFGQRRKTLRNALATLDLAPYDAAELLRRAGIDGGLRAEALDVPAFVRLAAALLQLRASQP
ncbi:16S rRNA (adenine(1518)-N(6)/adenine(1519)-N(6))-dimethyltransferase RsmA [Carboxydochorda subterranea]|uniref:Ribosomal RNA small subunit methyltransferase A n=1 Tax=Carboxydichorda subterranea TaxID=3109565 RepID=A0ABZ1BX17_9FIRM|nr:16S rRNA (adenine(1518)-N(6)/adenine(1519)-N(6))-dimethyltransferase RsmA [Limnochorda sp. L945t]WRP17071.1 16S rRNA (adenine(1518)-N(6)/adenine(1519)-N(6))-dimethyltransferase RsmA [Limnochorda sp. L945t]